MRKFCQRKNGTNKIAPIAKEDALRFSRSDAYKVLDTINFWIASCDTKASVLLSGIGVVFTIIFTSNMMEKLYILAKIIVIDFSGIRCTIGTIGLVSLAGCIVGLGYIISIILPRQIYKTKQIKDRNTAPTSIMFYGSIAQLSFSSYCEHLSSMCDTTDPILLDLLFQIHSTSIICSFKTKNLKTGSIILFSSLFIFALCFFLGYFELVI